MIVFDRNENYEPTQTNNEEIKLKSRAVSRGVAIGRIVCLHGHSRQFYRTDLKESQIGKEIKRFQRAVELTRKQLNHVISRHKQFKGAKKADIFLTHLMILEDKTLNHKIVEKIKTEKVNAEWAVKIVLDTYISRYKSIADEHLRDRYIDLRDISDRLLNALGGEMKSTIRLDKNSVIVAKEVKPSTLIELAASQPKAIIAENGGWTSHTFILARELNLPAVTGTKNILRQVQTGDEVIVDGYNGLVILHPESETLQKYEIAAAHFQKVSFDLIESSREQVKTLDGREVIIRANLDLHKGYSKARRLGAQGIGLYRSEFLFNQFKGFPSEAEQVEAYKRIGKLVGDKGVRIRTFDLSVDQLTDENLSREKNPALGLRGIRLGLSHKKEFRIQIRALLQASFEHRIDIVLPMISDVTEIFQTKEILRKEKNNLRRKKIKFGEPKIGAMIEVPSAVLTVDDISKEVDFLSLGTNDLVQYLLAVDRDNESVADWFKTLHPAVIKSVEKVLRAAEENEKPIIICGEMAGSPFYAPILIGLGARELSMNINSIPRIRRTIEGIAFEEAREITAEIRRCRTSVEIEQLVRDIFSEKWSHLFTPDILPVK
ncbi:MAG: phosphoenolpyruvate--protein phosphotransferase [Pyrinomonadaceae bacterium]